ncbi:MAG TPA: FAD-binding protein [Polyangiaceae bacterium]|jgi:cytokinin dehydrogenase
MSASSLLASAREDGVALDASPEAMGAGSSDFGHIARGRSLGVVRPGSARGVSEAIAFARRRGISLALRGGGMSQSGQSVAQDGLTLDLGEFRTVEQPNRARLAVRCGAGATWRQLLATTTPHGLVPRVAPLNLDLTIGGTLSAGGMGSSSHRHGLAVSNVLAAEVVLGTGDIVTCGPVQERPVYDAVLGGVGRCGVLTSVELALELAPAKVRTSFLLYEELDALLADQLTLAGRSGVLHLEAFCSASIQGLRRGPEGRRQPLRHWLYGLHVSTASSAGNAEPDSDLLDGLHHARVLHCEDDDVGPFFSRYDVRFEGMRAMGAWAQPHPWFEVLLPAAAAADLVRAAQELPAFLGDGHRLTVVAERDHPLAVAFPGSGPTVIFAVLPTGVPEPLLKPALGAVGQLARRAADAGGKRYLSGWLFEMGPEAWKAHYEERYDRLVALKDEFDPANVFRSRLAPLRA